MKKINIKKAEIAHRMQFNSLLKRTKALGSDENIARHADDERATHKRDRRNFIN